MIYPIAEMMERFFASIVDEETGEVLMTDEEMQTALDGLQMDFDEKIEQLRNEVINLTAEAEALKLEKTKLDKRKKSAENGAERAKRFLAYLLQGEKYKKGAVSISYRKSDKLVIDDEAELLKWAKMNGPGFLKEPELREGDIKTAIKNGAAIPFAHVEMKNNVQVK